VDEDKAFNIVRRKLKVFSKYKDKNHQAVKMQTLRRRRNWKRHDDPLKRNWQEI